MLGNAKVLKPTGHWGLAALISCLKASRCLTVGVRESPSAVRHSNVAPHRSIREPSCSWFVSFSTIFPLCWADLVSRRLNTFPHTDISLHTPGLESSVNPLRGCITRTPFVVSPSICPSDVFHFAAFSPRKMFFEESNPAAYILAVKGGLRSHMILQANLDIVLCTDCVSELLWLPGTVSVTTKSIGLSVDLPICKKG